MKTQITFKPFPVGAIRGPFTCGKGTDPAGGVQFAVNTANGWAYFIENKNNEAGARLKAEQFAARLDNPSN